MVQRCRREEVKCRVCFDRQVKCVFVPCGHLSCEECGLRLTHCHICRKSIEIRQRCYFPWEEDNGDAPRAQISQIFQTTADQNLDLSQPSSSASNIASSTTTVTLASAAAVKTTTAATDTPDGSTGTSVSSKPQRTVAFNVSVSLESDQEPPVEESTSEEDVEGGEVMHPGAFDFFYQHRRRYKRERQSSSTSSAVSIPIDRTSPRR